MTASVVFVMRARSLALQFLTGVKVNWRSLFYNGMPSSGPAGKCPQVTGHWKAPRGLQHCCSSFTRKVQMVPPKDARPEKPAFSFLSHLAAQSTPEYMAWEQKGKGCLGRSNQPLSQIGAPWVGMMGGLPKIKCYYYCYFVSKAHSSDWQPLLLNE